VNGQRNDNQFGIREVWIFTRIPLANERLLLKLAVQWEPESFALVVVPGDFAISQENP
jgi:hypothetical protein